MTSITKKYEIYICEPCYNFEGQMCHNPNCALIRRTTAEIKEILDILLIRPKIDKELYETMSEADKNFFQPSI